MGRSKYFYSIQSTIYAHRDPHFDYGWNDPDTAAVRGAIYGEMLRTQSAAPLVDISHGIPPRNHQEAAYVLRAAYPTFPKGSIHIVLVDCFDVSEYSPIAMELDGHYFLSLNHGGLSLLRPDLKPSQIIRLDLKNRLELQTTGSAFGRRSSASAQPWGLGTFRARGSRPQTAPGHPPRSKKCANGHRSRPVR